MTKSTEPSYEQEILQRLAEAGVAGGLNTSQLKFPSTSSQKGKAYRQVLQQLLKRGEVANLGSKDRPRFLLAQYFQPLELAYAHIEGVARQSGTKLGSKSSLAKGLTGKVAKRVDEAIKLLVQEGRLLRFSWGAKSLYLHASALPQPHLATPSAEAPTRSAILNAYKETVAEFGYPDVLIHEVFLRLGGDLEAFKAALKQACQEGKAVAGIGDWSLSSPEERAAVLYIDGHPHLRIRIRE